MPPTDILPEVRAQLRVRQLAPYGGVVHNDEVNDFGHVVITIMLLTHLKAEDAVARTMEAHETGQSVLLVTHRERAELYVEQFASCSLTVTAEPDA